MSAQKIMKSVVKQLSTAGLEAVVRYAQGVLIVAAEDASQAKEILGMESYSGYINEIEIILV